MSHIDTLQVYEEYRAAGMDDLQAKKMTAILEKSFMTKVNDLKHDFASNKVLSIWGSIIAVLASILIGLGGFTLNQVWHLSHDMTEVKTRLTIIETKIKP